MKFIADLHIHSKYSRATAKNLDLENLYIEAQKKGITVLGTGDCTHPAWFQELKEKLIPAEEGLFRLKPDIEKACAPAVPASCRGDVRFILESEISNIYKKNDKTRKNHNLVFFPDFDSAEKFNIKLDAIGNIKSDGRPILGLDARNLLEILLETNDNGFLIPAHIWTPWFSLLGSKSGFNSVQECFEDLTPEIFAVETGLSSDPSMNWRVSALDGLTLVSNSDAHSPAKLGREANLFNTGLSYPDIRNALKTGNPETFLGTMEFFPEEGKYHNDGHRKCNISLTPEESSDLMGICPKCGKTLTLGVNYRVLELADRAEGERPEIHHPFHSIIPLEEIIAEITGTGAKSKKVQRALSLAVEKLGSEFDILRRIPVDEIKTSGIPLLADAIERMRCNRLHIIPGFDGEFGKIKLFTENEKEELLGQTMLFSFINPALDYKGFIKAGSQKNKGTFKKDFEAINQWTNEKNAPMAPALNELQEKAVRHNKGPLVIVAGPGTGKTHTLTQKIAWLIKEKKVSPQQILAITFTVKAAGELKERLNILVGKSAEYPFTATFHALCYSLLKEYRPTADPFSIIDESGRENILGISIKKAAISLNGVKPAILSKMIEEAKQNILSPEDNLSGIADKFQVPLSLFESVYSSYRDTLLSEKLYDYEDLIFNIVRLFHTDTDFIDRCRERFKYIFVDEYQDLNLGQYKIVRALAPKEGNICVIGDPDQAIYGFRGSDSAYFNRFMEDYPGAEMINLNQNYRSTETILKASFQVIKKNHETENTPGTPVWSGIEGPKTINLLENTTEKSEAVAIGKIIEQMIGGTGFHSIDFGKAHGHNSHELSFSDFAVLFRTGSEGKAIAEVFDKGGIPYQIVSRDGIYKLKAISGLLSCLKVLNSPDCSHIDLEWISIPETEKETDIKEILSIHREKTTGMDVQDQLIYIQQNVKGIREEIRNNKKAEEAFYHILKMSGLFGSDVNDFLKTTALNSDHDMYDFKAEKVALMSMHAAKGLEFPVVFISGCENENIPYIRKGPEETDLCEERRLFYVAMTRAKKNLFLSFAKKRTIFGKSEERQMSPFIKDVEKKLIRIETSAYVKIENKVKPVQLSLF